MRFPTKIGAPKGLNRETKFAEPIAQGCKNFRFKIFWIFARKTIFLSYQVHTKGGGEVSEFFSFDFRIFRHFITQKKHLN